MSLNLECLNTFKQQSQMNRWNSNRRKKESNQRNNVTNHLSMTSHVTDLSTSPSTKNTSRDKEEVKDEHRFPFVPTPLESSSPRSLSSFSSVSTFQTQPELNHLIQEMQDDDHHCNQKKNTKTTQKVQSSFSYTKTRRKNTNALMDSTNHGISSSSNIKGLILHQDINAKEQISNSTISTIKAMTTTAKPTPKPKTKPKPNTTPKTFQLYNTTGKTPRMNNLASSTIFFTSDESKRNIPHYRKVIDIHQDDSPPPHKEHKECNGEQMLVETTLSSSSSMDCSSPREGEISSEYEHEANVIHGRNNTNAWTSPPVLKTATVAAAAAATTTTAKDNVHGMDILQHCIDSRGEPHITKGILRRAVNGPADNQNILKKMLNSCNGGKNTGGIHAGKDTRTREGMDDESIMYVMGSTVEIKRTSSFDSVGSSITQGTLNEEEKKYTLALLKRTNIVLQDDNYISECKDTGMILVHQELPSGWNVGFSAAKNVPVYTHPDYGRSLHMPVVQTKSIHVYDPKGNLCITFTKTPLSKQLDVHEHNASPTQNGGQETSSCDSTSNGSLLVRQIASASRRKSCNVAVLDQDIETVKETQWSIHSENQDSQISDTAVDYQNEPEESHSSDTSEVPKTPMDTESSAYSSQSPNSVIPNQSPDFENLDEGDEDDRSCHSTQSMDEPNRTPTTYSSSKYSHELESSGQSQKSLDVSKASDSYSNTSSLANDHDQSDESNDESCSPVSRFRLHVETTNVQGFTLSKSLTERLSKILHPLCSLQRLDAIIAKNKIEWRENIRNRRKTLQGEKKTVGQLSSKKKKRITFTSNIHKKQKILNTNGM